MIPEYIQQRLQKNWGPKAEAMDCKCECRLQDSSSGWEWYPYAQDPMDPDCLLVIENTDELIPDKIMSLAELECLFNYAGNSLELDDEFRPRVTAVLYKELKKRRPNEN